MRDQIDVALEAARGAVQHLRSALCEADPIQALLILPLIRRAARLEVETGALLSAVDAADEGGAS